MLDLVRHWICGPQQPAPRRRKRKPRARNSRPRITPRQLRSEELEGRALLTVVPVTAVFRDGVFPDAGYAGAADTKIVASYPKTNYGTKTTLAANGRPDVASLMKWDLTGIPAGSTIQSVTLTVNVTGTTRQTYELYALKRPWTERQATWKTASTGDNWERPGASGPNDRSTAVLGTMTASTTGLKTFSLNTAGAAQLQAWIDDPNSNYGFVLHDYANTDGFQFSSSEVKTAFRRPKLEVTYVPPAANLAPVVSAGPGLSLTLPSSATLDGTVSDDELPNPLGAVTTTWTKVSGPGTVTFANAAAVDTTASFSVAGDYVLRLTANDGELSSSDDVAINVAAPANEAPVVSAGPDLSLTLPFSAALDGAVGDDGLPNPPGAVTTTWTKVSGPGTVTFANAAEVDTTASFSAAGDYVLRLTANDGALSSSDEVAINVAAVVAPTNEAPVVSAGPDLSLTLPSSATLDGAVGDDGLPNPPGTVTTTWTKVSGPGTVTFANAAAVDTTASFNLAGAYVLRLTANDGALSSSDEVAINVAAVVAPTNEAPVVSAGPDRSVTLPSSAALDGTVSDDGLPNPLGAVTTTWTKVSGPGTVTFANAAAVDTTASFSAAGTYVLRLTASDGSLSASDDTTVTVASEPVVQGTGIWISKTELMSLPTSGPAWDTLYKAAQTTANNPNISNQDDNTDVLTLAKALVGVRLGNQTLINQARANIMAAIGTEAGGRTLALGRNLASYVIAADIVGLDAAQDASFRTWLRKTLTETLDGMTLQSTHEKRPNNWGTMAGASRATVAAYLGDQAELARTAQVFKGWLGDRASYAGFKYGDLSWQADPSKPVGINVKGAVKQGYSIDGALPEEMRRGGTFQWPPAYTNYAWGALQGAFTQAEILRRAGYDTYNWQDQALLRAAKFLYETVNWKPSGDDQWQPWLIDARYGTRYADNPQASPGKIMGWTAWTHQPGTTTAQSSALLASVQSAPTSTATTFSTPPLTTASTEFTEEAPTPAVVAPAPSDPIGVQSTDAALAMLAQEDAVSGSGNTESTILDVDVNAAGFGEGLDLNLDAELLSDVAYRWSR